jgi:crotonobetainyl-CoA:carnitine CoA-transferase CaiB-like acyl-CoA transferase
MTMGKNKLPLVGIKVVDFSRHLPGSWCTQMLADLDAKVVKIERPEGDPSRHNPPLYSGESVYFCSVNGGKQSLALDLSKEEGRAAAHALIADADILVESYGRGGAEKLDVRWERAASPGSGNPERWLRSQVTTSPFRQRRNCSRWLTRRLRPSRPRTTLLPPWP